MAFKTVQKQERQTNAKNVCEGGGVWCGSLKNAENAIKGTQTKGSINKNYKTMFINLSQCWWQKNRERRKCLGIETSGATLMEKLRTIN